MSLLQKLPNELQQTAQGYRHFSSSDRQFYEWVSDVMNRRNTPYEDTVLACSKALQSYVTTIEQEYGKEAAQDFTRYTGIDKFFSIGENNERKNT